MLRPDGHHCPLTARCPGWSHPTVSPDAARPDPHGAPSTQSSPRAGSCSRRLPAYSRLNSLLPPHALDFSSNTRSKKPGLFCPCCQRRCACSWQRGFQHHQLSRGLGDVVAKGDIKPAPWLKAPCRAGPDACPLPQSSHPPRAAMCGTACAHRARGVLRALPARGRLSAGPLSAEHGPREVSD